MRLLLKDSDGPSKQTSLWPGSLITVFTTATRCDYHMQSSECQSRKLLNQTTEMISADWQRLGKDFESPEKMPLAGERKWSPPARTWRSLRPGGQAGQLPEPDSWVQSSDADGDVSLTEAGTCLLRLLEVRPHRTKRTSPSSVSFLSDGSVDCRICEQLKASQAILFNLIVKYFKNTKIINRNIYGMNKCQYISFRFFFL